MEEFEKSNIMIAKFMNVPQGSHTHFMIDPFSLESYANADDLKYDISWDWLMPVVVKCFNEQDKVSENFIFVLGNKNTLKVYFLSKLVYLHKMREKP